MKMALQIGGTTVIDNSRHLVNIAGGTVPNATDATNATNLTGTGTGSINSSALATGTADSTTFLRGDRTWVTVSTESPAPTTAQVLNATAGASVGAVGTYALLLTTFGATTANVTSSYQFGTTHGGSSLRYTNTIDSGGAASSQLASNTAPAGTWRAMGQAFRRTVDNYNNSVYSATGTVFLRIS